MKPRLTASASQAAPALPHGAAPLAAATGVLQVNRRLAAEDQEDPSKADPASPHAQFPPAELCSKCRRVGPSSARPCMRVCNLAAPRGSPSCPQPGPTGKGAPASPGPFKADRPLTSRAHHLALRRQGEGAGNSKDEAVQWEEEEVYRFLLDFYSGQQPARAVAAAAAGGGGSRPAGWADAGLLLCVVAACVYGVLRRSGQYAMRKSSSRLL